MSFLGDATSDLFTSLLVEAGGEVQVSRNGGPPVAINAVRARAGTQRYGSLDQFYGTSHVDDFVFKASDYVSLVGGTPDEYDRITWVDDDGRSRIFQVGVDGVERMYDPVGQFGLVYRVHTTEIE